MTLARCKSDWPASSGICDNPTYPQLRTNRFGLRINRNQELYKRSAGSRVAENISSTGITMRFIFKHTFQCDACSIVEIRRKSIDTQERGRVITQCSQGLLIIGCALQGVRRIKRADLT